MLGARGRGIVRHIPFATSTDTVVVSASSFVTFRLVDWPRIKCYVAALLRRHRFLSGAILRSCWHCRFIECEPHLSARFCKNYTIAG